MRIKHAVAATLVSAVLLAGLNAQADPIFFVSAGGNAANDDAWKAAAGTTFRQNFDKSYLLAKIAKSLDVPLMVVQQELERRKQILLSMVEKNLRDFRSVHKALNSSLAIADLTVKDTEE